MNKLSQITQAAPAQHQQDEQAPDQLVPSDGRTSETRSVAERVTALLRPSSAQTGRKRRFTLIKPRAGQVHIIGGDVLLL